ncbi:FAD-dependent oxidoreductase [Bartonella sp. DGB2]|uniref:FAD-dependent oxidoreductase n=1 Tax=Bartonella sp. DGB2 TaxID=3388426 RepID=UPI00398FFC7B
MKHILVKGAGVGGLTAAYALWQKGARLTVAAPPLAPIGSASWYAGGMLAPHCERESADPCIETEGLQSMLWWRETLPLLYKQAGTLVVAKSRDSTELQRFSTRTRGYKWVDKAGIQKLEPNLEERFIHGLFYADEAHIDPRQALLTLKSHLKENGVTFTNSVIDESAFDLIIDATGIANAVSDLDLRGVRGEMLLLKNPDISLNRPIRLLHPRIPLYVVPRDDHIFMVGATMIESDSLHAISARSMMELLNAAYALHPSFAEAEVIEANAALRPAYSDNIPQLKRAGNVFYINGFYRHGYLLAPLIAQKLVQQIMEEK